MEEYGVVMVMESAELATDDPTEYFIIKPWKSTWFDDIASMWRVKFLRGESPQALLNYHPFASDFDRKEVMK